MDKKKPTPEEDLTNKISDDVKHRLRAKREGKEIMFGMGVFGIIGWSITVPTLLGVALGLYLDARFQVRFSWTLTLMFAGLIMGCYNAWRWINQKSNRRK
ncbi:MAG: AtpZ/AtpI family protein [Bacillota bacterium]